MANRQLEVVGTEDIGKVKISKKAKQLIDEHRDAINEATQANVKKRDTKLAVIARLKEEKVEVYVDTEADPEIVIDARDKPNLVVKKRKKVVKPAEETPAAKA